MARESTLDEVGQLLEERTLATIKQRGRRARERAQDRAMERTGTSRIADIDWYPEIQKMDDAGWKNREIASALNLSERRIQQIKAAGAETWAPQFRAAKAQRALGSEYQAMMEESADAFKAFFEHFSGMPLSDFGYEMVEEFLRHRNLMVNVPPRHAKSTIMAVWLPIWLLTKDRNEQIIIVSKTQHLAKTHALTIAFELEYNRPLIETFGRYAPQKTGDSPWRPSRGELLILGRTKQSKSGQLSILARGAGQQILGTEATTIILDDATDKQTSESPTESERHMSWVRDEVLSRLEPGGRAVVVGQRVHLADMYGVFEAMEGVRGEKKGQKLWHTIKYPAILRWPDENPEYPEPKVLWPERWTYEELMESYDRMGHSTFERMYQQNPLPDGSAFVRPEWWERCRDYDRRGYQSVQSTSGENFLPIVRVASIDPSPTQENALVVADVVALRDTMAISIMETKKWVGQAREFVQEIDRCIDSYALDYLIIESSTMTKWFENDPEFERLRHKVRIIAHNTGRNKGDEDLGVLSLAADIEAGRIRLPYGDAPGARMSGILEHEANVYGHGFPDDLLMALWFIKWNYKILRPRRALKGFAGKQGQPWGFITRANDARAQQDKRVQQWRKAHARGRS